MPGGVLIRLPAALRCLLPGGPREGHQEKLGGVSDRSCFYLGAPARGCSGGGKRPGPSAFRPKTRTSSCAPEF